MKVLQTLGRHQTQVGIFQYKRTPEGVEIDSSVGQASLSPSRIVITHAEWTTILTEIKQRSQKSFRLSGIAPFTDPPKQSLYELFSAVVQKPSGGWQWNDSWRSYVCAILEHEGSIDLYHGALGPGVGAHITMASDL